IPRATWPASAPGRRGGVPAAQSWGAGEPVPVEDLDGAVADPDQPAAFGLRREAAGSSWCVSVCWHGQETTRVWGRNAAHTNQNVSMWGIGARFCPVSGPALAWPSTDQWLPVSRSRNPPAAGRKCSRLPATTGLTARVARPSAPPAIVPLDRADAVPGCHHTVTGCPAIVRSIPRRCRSVVSSTATAAPRYRMPTTLVFAAYRP